MQKNAQSQAVIHYLLIFKKVSNEKALKQFKCLVECFLIQVVINKCFLLNPEKKLAQIRFVVFEKNAKKRALLFQKMASPSRRLEG